MARKVTVYRPRLEATIMHFYVLVAVCAPRAARARARPRAGGDSDGRARDMILATVNQAVTRHCACTHHLSSTNSRYYCNSQYVIKE